MTFFIFLYKNKMAQKIANHVDENTPHKDRLVLVALVAVLAFQVVNTYLLAANVDVVSASLALS